MTKTRKLKVHLLTVLVVDFDQLGQDGVVTTLENTRYVNRCIAPEVISVESREIEWDDDHPLNQNRDRVQAVQDVFER